MPLISYLKVCLPEGLLAERRFVAAAAVIVDQQVDAAVERVARRAGT